MITKIVVDLENWGKPYPTGIVAYDYKENVVKSEYCDEEKEFMAFIDDCKEDIYEDVELMIHVNADDFFNNSLNYLVSAIKVKFLFVRDEKRNK